MIFGGTILPVYLFRHNTPIGAQPGSTKRHDSRQKWKRIRFHVILTVSDNTNNEKACLVLEETLQTIAREFWTNP